MKSGSKARGFSVYHDLIAKGLKVVNKPTRLRTQAKNAEREDHSFVRSLPPRDARSITVTYPPAEVRRHGSVMAAIVRGDWLQCLNSGFQFACA